MNDFVREIQEDIQRQKWQALWERHGKRCAYVISAILLAVGGWQVMKYMERTRHIKDTDQLLAAVKAHDVAAFKEAAEKTSGVHHGFAGLIEAQLLENKGEHEVSEKKLAELAAKHDKTLPYDLARALSTTTDKSADIFSLTALERSGWQALEVGDADAAKKAFEAIVQAGDVPPSMVDRAKAGIAYAAANSGKKE